MPVTYEPEGGEFLVNTTTANHQYAATVAALAGGGYVVTWTSELQDGSGNGVYMQRYDAFGVSQGNETLVNTTTFGGQTWPAITALSDGGYVITWMGFYAGSNAILTQRYDSAGAPQGGETVVNTTVADNQGYPAAAALQGGGYVITWVRHASDGSGWNVYAQRYGASGAPQGSETLVNTSTTDIQDDVSAAGLEGGGYVITWTSWNQDGSGLGVYAQRYDASGIPQGGETLVNTTTEGNQLHSSVAALQGGGYVVTWSSTGGVHMQRYDAAGAAQGAETLIGPNGGESSVSALPGGGFVVTWQTYFEDGSGYGIYAQV